MRVNPEMWGAMMIAGLTYHVESGLPKDAIVVGVNIEPQSGDLLLLFESEEFEPVTEGDMVPALSAGLLIVTVIEQGE